jgi:hypothetical protein
MKLRNNITKPEEEFMQTLEQVLSFGKTQKVVANLLAQIQADEG